MLRSATHVLTLVTLAASAFAQGAVYTQSNAAGSNQVLAFARAGGGLTPSGVYSTGGLGAGSGLGSQGAVTFSRDGRFLLVTNAGSNDVSVLRVTPAGLQLTDREPSQGMFPTSVAIGGELVFVLNAGMQPSVAGFLLDNAGQLAPLPGSFATLAMGSAPAQVGLAPGGQQAIVTERATNLIDLFPILPGGALGAAVQIASAGATPFGFEFGRNNVLIVSEAAGGAADASSVSSYVIGPGALTAISSAVPTTESAACWIIMARNRRYAYTTNTGSSTVTGYRVSPVNGALTILDVDGVTGDLGAGANPLDGATSQDGKYMFVLSPATNEIASFFVRIDGSLEKLPSQLGLPSTSFGLAAR